MDTWLIAQCMAKLPPFTYFSHPESSLDDFFSGEADTTASINHQGGNSSGPAPHELQFLTSLRQSLGTYPPMESNGVELAPYYHPGRASSSGYSPDLARYHPRTTADERAMSQQLDDHRSIASTTDVHSSLAGPTTTTNSPFPSRKQIPAMSSKHVASCAAQEEPEFMQSRKITASPNSRNSRYQCNWEMSGQRPCGEWIEGGGEEVWTHVRTTHGLKGQYSGWCHCRWAGCLEKLKVSSLRRHLAKHLKIRWRCSGCDTIFSRHDYVRRHTRRNEECRGADCHPLGPGEDDRERGSER